MKLKEYIRVFIQTLPKTTIATILGAIITYLQATGVIDGALASLLASILVGCGITINSLSGKITTASLKKIKG